MLGIYTVIKPIKHGSFGSVFLGKNTITDDHVAIKVESNSESLQHETAILLHLSKDCRVVPPIFNYGKLKGKNYLVMPYYQTSLADYLSNGVSPEHAKEILREMFDILKHIHRRCIIHRDIKPANFMFKLDSAQTNSSFKLDGAFAPSVHSAEAASSFKSDVSLVLIDFGLATYFDKSAVAESKQGEFFIGSRRYASINIHLGHRPSRRDDLISAAYIYVAARWPKYMYDVDDRVDWLAKKQLDNLPEESRPLFQYLYSLAFMESPDYTVL